jgi:hypothetical protein
VPDDLTVLFCPTCGDERLAEAPPCVEGHGADCPDRACVECGTALLLDAPLSEAALGAARSSAVRAASRDCAGRVA